MQFPHRSFSLGPEMGLFTVTLNQQCAGKCLTTGLREEKWDRGGRKPWYVVFADFCGINTLGMTALTAFKFPI
jgi:hypothetical protein